MNSLILLFLFPIKLLKKTRIDNFVGGLIFGALFSLFVNIITVQFEDMLQRQRVFESLEQEIVGNMLLANQFIQFSADEVEKDNNPNPFLSFPVFNRRIWDASEAIKYIVALDPEVQSNLFAYYSIRIDGTNKISEKQEKFYESEYSNCFNKPTPEVSKKCQEDYNNLLYSYSDIVDGVYKGSSDLLKIFHPTQDRMNSKFLKLIIGDKSVKILQGE